MKASKEEGKDEEMFKWVLEAIPTLASAGALNQKSQVGKHVHIWPNVVSLGPISCSVGTPPSSWLVSTRGWKWSSI